MGRIIFGYNFYIIYNFKYILYSVFISSIFYFILTNINSLSRRFDLLISFSSANRDVIWIKVMEIIQLKPIFGYCLYYIV